MPEPADPPLPPGGDPLGDVRWQPWSLAEVASRLQNVDVPWAFAAGWALDLFRGRETRAHDDVEIAVPAAAFDLIREALTPYEFDIVGAGRRWPVSDGQALAHTHQTWLRNPETGSYHMDVFREPHDGGIWICRRNPALRLPYTELVRWTPDGLPYMAPEVVLLFKAKWDRPRTELISRPWHRCSTRGHGDG